MEIPLKITVLFSDANADTIKIKLDTSPFISGSINSVVNWMVSNPFGNVDMQDIKSGATLFFLACRYNQNNDLIKWLIKIEYFCHIHSHKTNYFFYTVTDIFTHF